MENTIDWEHIRVAFAEPFNPADVDFRVQGKASESTGKAQVVCFVDARTVQDRLDSVVGPGAWAFDYTPLMVDAKGVVLSAKGTLTIHGVSKSDIGDASNFEASKGTVSDALKRAAVLWGIGRYLYSVEAQWVPAEKGRIAPDVIASLRAKLPKPARVAANQEQPRTLVPQVKPPVTHVEQQSPAAQPAKPATKAAPQTTASDRKAAPAQGSVRLLGRKCGYESQADYDAMVVRVTHKSGKWTAADQWLVYDFLAEKQAIDAQRVMDAATQGEPELVFVEATA